MKLYQIIFSLAYIAVLISYFFSEVSVNFSRRAINKVILATMFLVYAYCEFTLRGGWSDPLFCILIVAFAFSWLGDVVLLFSFKRGGVIFGIGNLFYFAFLVLFIISRDIFTPYLLFAIPIFVLPVAIVAILYRRGWVSFGKYPFPLIFSYICSVSLHGSLGIVLAFSGVGGTGLLGAGLFLFMVSDYFLFAYEFKGKKKPLLVLNSATYFSGMLLAALSIPAFLG